MRFRKILAFFVLSISTTGILFPQVLLAQTEAPETDLTSTIAGRKSPIVMIVVDDLFDYRRFRNKFGVTIQTPNLDRLAARGVTFGNAQAPIGVCNGSRTAALTGWSQFRTGLHLTNAEQWYDLVPLHQNVVSAIGQGGYATYGTGKVFHNSANPNFGDFYETIYLSLIHI